MRTIRRTAWLSVLLLACCACSAATPDTPDSNKLSLNGLFADRGEQTACSPGTPVEQWARHYADHPDELSVILLRARPWLAHVAGEVQRRGLPAELILLPIAESGYDPFARSTRNAGGAWQLMPETAESLGLSVNHWFDGRHDMPLATTAALDYLAELYKRFDRRLDLTLAAYNAGPGRVARILHPSGARAAPGWDQLSLPGETRIFIARVLGLGCLFSRPAHPGQEGAALIQVPGFVELQVPGPIDLVALAATTGIDLRSLVALNSGLKTQFTPPDGPHRILVPSRYAESARQSLKAMTAAEILTWSQDHRHRHAHPAGLARHHAIDPELFINLNRLQNNPVRIGQQLLIPSVDTRPADPPYHRLWQSHVELKQHLHPDNRLRHRVRRGENLWTLSQRYTVSAQRIRQWNGLSSAATIRPGQVLDIPPAGPALALHEYQVQPNDTLWSIARIHGLSVASLAELNGISANHTLRTGQVLAIGEEGCCNPLDRIPAL